MAEYDHPALPTIVATPDIDGNWIGDVPEPSRHPYAITATADCGDASADGFRYVPRLVQGGHDDPPPVEESDPQSQSLETPTATAADPIPGSPTLTG